MARRVANASSCPCSASHELLLQVEFFEEDLGALVKLLNARPGVPKIWAGPAEHWNANRGLGRCQGSAAAARAAVGGSLGAVPNPCDRQELFEGAFAHCGRGLLSFFADDVRLLFSPTNGTA